MTRISPKRAFSFFTTQLLQGPLTCHTVTQADPIVLCHAGLQCYMSLLGCVRAAEVAEEMGCFRQGLVLLDMGWAVLLPGLDKVALASLTSQSVQTADQAGVEALWDTVWTQCKEVGCSNSTLSIMKLTWTEFKVPFNMFFCIKTTSNNLLN